MVALSARARLALAGVALLLAAACGASDREPASGAAVPPLAPPDPHAAAATGTYVVQGVTVQAQTGLQREIEGTLDLHVEGVHYEVSFELDTTAPIPEKEVPVRVRGSGQGFIVGSVFTGTTEEWMTLVPPEGGLEAVELEGVVLPERAGLKIVSTSQATIDRNGDFHILIENYPGEGQRYEASVTVLAGRRKGEASGAPRPADR